ncbi:MAG: inorganic diphosphatase [bacterium]|nr:inorganic diphosphatase [bacterium]
MSPFVQYLGQTLTVKIDRPLGSKHPKWDFEYPINYGFLPNTKAADGEEIDAYVLGVAEPIEEFAGVCIAIIHRLNDNDDKLIIAPASQNFTDEEIRQLTDFQEKFFKSVIIR